MPSAAAVAVDVPPLHLISTAAPAIARPEAAVPATLSGAGAGGGGGGGVGELLDPPQPANKAPTATPVAMAIVAGLGARVVVRDSFWSMTFLRSCLNGRTRRRA